MTKIKVYTKEDMEYGSTGTELRMLRPRTYMTSYSFEQLMKYTKEELYWADIKEEDVVGFTIYNKEQHWVQNIERSAN